MAKLRISNQKAASKVTTKASKKNRTAQIRVSKQARANIQTEEELLANTKTKAEHTESTVRDKAQTENKNDNAKNNTNMSGIGDVIGSASNIVMKAASILEVEIARGIVAAKQVEEKYSNVPKIRSGEITSNRQFDDLFVRFRKDAHDILDLIVDFAAIAAQGANRVTSQFIRIGSSRTSTTNSSHQQVPLIQVPGELKAGEQTSFPVTLENDNANESKTIIFVNSPLTDSPGNQLPATALTFNPNPLTLQPSSTGNVTVTLSIPAEAKPGNYNCFIQAHNSESLKATLMVKVV
ncbi:MAG: COG1470 family protein [Flavisolibacter sp.]